MWHHSFFIHHRTPEGRITDPFTMALQRMQLCRCCKGKGSQVVGEEMMRPVDEGEVTCTIGFHAVDKVYECHEQNFHIFIWLGYPPSLLMKVQFSGSTQLSNSWLSCFLKGFMQNFCSWMPFLMTTRKVVQLDLILSSTSVWFLREEMLLPLHQLTNYSSIIIKNTLIRWLTGWAGFNVPLNTL